MKRKTNLLVILAIFLALTGTQSEARTTVVSASSAKALNAVFQYMHRRRLHVEQYAYQVTEGSRDVTISAIAPTAVEHPEYARGGFFFKVSRKTGKILEFAPEK